MNNKEQKSNLTKAVNVDNKASIVTVEQRSGSAGGVTLFLFGMVVMLSGLFYDTTTCRNYGSDCTHNIGLIHESSNILNFGGFLCICGCVLNVKPAKPKAKD